MRQGRVFPDCINQLLWLVFRQLQVQVSVTPKITTSMIPQTTLSVIPQTVTSAIFQISTRTIPTTAMSQTMSIQTSIANSGGKI